MEQLLKRAPRVVADGVARRADGSVPPDVGARERRRASGATRCQSAWRRVVTDGERVQFVRFTPNGSHLLYGRDVGGNENTQLLRVLPTGEGVTDPHARAGGEAHVRPRLRRRALDGLRLNARSRGDFDIFTCAASPTTPPPCAACSRPPAPRGRCRTPRRGEARRGGGRSTSTRRPVVEVAGGAVRTLTAHPGEGDVRHQSPRFTRDGASLFVLSDRAPSS